MIVIIITITIIIIIIIITIINNIIMAVLASDGLWDTHTNEEAVALVREIINF